MSTSENLNVTTSKTTVKGGYWVSGSQAVDAIDSKLFTHLFCAFASVSTTSYEVTFPSSNSEQFSTFSKIVKKTNPAVKTLLSIGGESEPIRSTLAKMARHQDRRKAFIESSIKLARDNDFDGLDLYWEYPTNKDQMKNFGSLLDQWHDAVVDDAGENGGTIDRRRLLLTAVVYCSPKLPQSDDDDDDDELKYPFSALKDNLDWINVKSYDFYSPKVDQGQECTLPPAALHPGDTTDNTNGNMGITNWLKYENMEIPANKIVFGLPFYGYAWELKNPLSYDYDYHKFKMPANGPAKEMEYPQPYKQIKALTDTLYTKKYDEKVVSNYRYGLYGTCVPTATTWIAYDDEESIIEKVSYAKKKLLRGYFAWHTGYDDSASTLSKAANDAWTHA